ncbi:MAG TPA: helix-turn-helix domain-containing protein [Pseudolysinimonas sp.]|jgi:IclR family acetate operon transcriptional repressor
MTDGGADSGSVRSVMRALRVFERVAQSRGARVGELAVQLELSKSTVQRVLRTLNDAGWIRPTGDDVTSWEIAPRARALLQSHLTDVELRRRAIPVMEALRDRTGETVQLTVPSGQGRVVIAERIDSAHEVRSVLPVGTVFDAREVAGGLALRGQGDDEPRGTVRRAGWVAAPSPTGQSIGLAAPVSDGSGSLVGALVLVIPTDRHRAQLDDRLGGQVVESARELSRALGAD